MEEYSVGDRILCNEVWGTVVPNVKMPGDICIKWDSGQFSSYDVEWLREHTQNTGAIPTPTPEAASE
jgi:hypothetical protein